MQSSSSDHIYSETLKSIENVGTNSKATQPQDLVPHDVHSNSAEEAPNATPTHASDSNGANQDADSENIPESSEVPVSTSPAETFNWEHFLHDHPEVLAIPGVSEFKERFLEFIEENMVQLHSDFCMDDYLFEILHEIVPEQKPDADKANEFIFRFRVYTDIVLPDVGVKLEIVSGMINELNKKQDQLIEKYALKSAAAEDSRRVRKSVKAGQKVKTLLRVEARKAVAVLSTASLWLFSVPQIFMDDYAAYKDKFDLPISKEEMSDMLHSSFQARNHFTLAGKLLKAYTD